MAEHAVKTERDVNRTIGLGQRSLEVPNSIAQGQPTEPSQVLGGLPCNPDLLLRYIETTRAYFRKPEQVSAPNDTTQPGAGTASCVDNGQGRDASLPQCAQLCIQNGPDMLIRATVLTAEDKQVLWVAVSVRNISRACAVIRSRGIAYLAIVCNKEHAGSSCRTGHAKTPVLNICPLSSAKHAAPEAAPEVGEWRI